MTIRVGQPLWRGGHVYYSVRGYAQETVWVRQSESGDLLFIDPQDDVERPLTSFRATSRAGCAPAVTFAASRTPSALRLSR